MKKGLMILVAAALIIAVGLGGLSYSSHKKSVKEFASDGFVIDPSLSSTVSDDAYNVYYFSEGDTYKERYGSEIQFSDKDGNDRNVTTEHFVHYGNGSLGAFTKGALVDVESLGTDAYSYYSLTKNTILVKNGSNYELTTKGETVKLTEGLWKLSDVDYMLLSPSVVLHIGGQDVKFSDYIQITYVDKGIVRLSHVDGTYQTVASDSSLTTASGAQLNLISKSFFSNGEALLSLDQIAVDDNDYISADENMDSSGETDIPQFVVNDGESGDDGEEGEDGEVGQSGTSGNSGNSGVTGVDGYDGYSGSDGLEGDTGIMGYDGQMGANGKDASTANDSSSLDSAELKIKPSVSVESVGGEQSKYSITSASASMTLNLEDVDGALQKGADTTMVKLYNKETMELVSSWTEEYQLAAGQSLENSNSANVNFTGLKADTEYLVVVEATYMVEDGQYYEGQIYSKSFKTDELGVKLSKLAVKEDSVSVHAEVDSTSKIDSYTIQYYKLNDDGTEMVLANVTKTATGGSLAASCDSMFGTNETTGDLEPMDGTKEGDAKNAGYKVDSDSVFYARLVNVSQLTDTGASQLINADNTDIELRTLKAKPYNKTKANLSTPVYEYVPAMTPKLTGNNTNHSLILEFEDDIMDKDSGIEEYRYELYDTQSSNYDTNLDNCTPAYTKTSKTLERASFPIDDNDSHKYVGRIVVVFDNNETEVEYASMASTATGLDSKDTSLLVTFINLQKTSPSAGGRPDTISGTLRIKDPTYDSVAGTGAVLPYVSGTYPVKLVITGEYGDIHTLTYNSIATSNGWNQVDSVTYDMPFTMDGLHADGTYTVVAYGPYDTDKDKTISGAEGQTYLAGERVKTTKTKNLTLVGAQKSSATSAFAVALNLTKSTDTTYTAEDGTESTVGDEYFEYETSTLTSMTFALTHNKPDGSAKTMGTYTIKDSDVRPRDSDFQDVYMDRDDTQPNTYSQRTANLADMSSADKYVLTPANFTLNDNDSEFAEGGTFTISVVSATDYAENVIPFDSKENSYTFEIDERHVQVDDPNVQVRSEIIKNAGAAAGYENADLLDDTDVGFRFSADYYGTDGVEVIYTIYEVDSTINRPTYQIDGYTDSSMSEKQTESATTVTFTEADALSGGTLKKVLRGNVILTGHVITDTELYFKDTACLDQANTTWYSYMDSNGGAIDENDLKTGTLSSSIETESGTNLKYTKVTNLDNKTILKRGKRYIVSYKIQTNENLCDPDNDPATNDLYPECTYTVADVAAGNVVPLYRSEVLDTTKQIPSLERYIYQTIASDNKMQFKYRIIDPDDALVVDSAGKTKFTNIPYTDKDAVNQWGGANNTSNLRNAQVVADEYKGTFKTMEFANLSSGKYYTTAVDYKVKEVQDDAETLVSDPVLYTAPAKVDEVKRIRLQGLVPGTSDNPEAEELTKLYKNDGTVCEDDSGDETQFYKSIINQGGYRYVLTFRGLDVPKCAGVKVKFTGLSASGDVVTDTGTGEPVTLTYDPIYIDSASIGTVKIEDATEEMLSDLCGGNTTELNKLLSKKSGGESIEYYAKAYVDTAAMAKFTDTNASYSAPVAQVKAEIVGYYVNGNVGFGDFASEKLTYEDTFDTDKDNLYALIRIKADGTREYLSRNNGNWQSAGEYPSASIFVPGSGDTTDSTTGLTGFNMDSSVALNSSLQAACNLKTRFAAKPLVQGADAVEATGDLTLNFNGTGATTGEDVYYMAEKIDYGTKKLIAVDGANTGDITGRQAFTMPIGDIQPAVEDANERSIGATSGVITVNVLGAGADTSKKIYARLYKVNQGSTPTLLQIERKSYEDENNETKYFYQLKRDGNSQPVEDATSDKNSYKQSSFGDQNIPLEMDGTDLRAETSVRGLDRGTTYQLVYFAYDEDGEIMDLYSVTGGYVGAPYSFTTKDAVQIEVVSPVFNFASYSNKKANVDFYLMGDEGAGMLIYYDVYTGTTASGTSVIHGEVQPLGKSYKYYSDQPNTNKVIGLSMNPKDANRLNLNTDYTIKVYAVDEQDTDAVLGEKTLTFRYDGEDSGSLLSPTYYTPISQSEQGDKVYVTANIVSTDLDRAIYDDTYQVSLYHGDADIDTATPIETKSVNRAGTTQNVSGDTHKGSVTFDTGLTKGATYKLVVVGNIDKANNGSTTVEKHTISFVASASPKALIGVEATNSECTFTLEELQNFEAVTTLAVTLYNNNGTSVASATFNETGGIANGYSKSFVLDSLENGKYTFAIQYRDAAGNPLGDTQSQKITIK